MISPKDPAEIITVSFDFSALSETVSAAAVSAAWHDGTADPAAQAIVSGAAQVQGAMVLQQIVGGQAGTTYRLRCQVDLPDGRRYVLATVLPVRTA